MSYNRKPYYNNRRNNFGYNRYNAQRNTQERRPYYKRPYNKNRSRSNSRNKFPKKRPYSKKGKRIPNMYNKNEYLSSSSSSSSLPNNDFFVDREKTCPFLLRIFYKINGYNALSTFTGNEFPPELDIYTWEDADLKELAKKIHSALKDTVLGMYDLYKFSRIYYDSKGTLLRDDIGDVVINDKYSKLNHNAKMTLKEIKFQIGDYFDINITSVNGKNI